MENFAQLKSTRVIVIDDGDFDRLLPGLILRPFGFMVHETQDIKEALEVLNRTSVSILIFGINAQGFEEAEILRRIRQHPDPTDKKVLAYTENTSQQVEQELLKMGFDAVLFKPLSSQSLMESLREFFPAKSLLRSKNETFK